MLSSFTLLVIISHEPHRQEKGYSVQVEALIPIWVEILLGNLCRPRLLATDGGYRERVGLFYEAVRSYKHGAEEGC